MLKKMNEDLAGEVEFKNQREYGTSSGCNVSPISSPMSEDDVSHVTTSPTGGEALEEI